jgi:carbamoyl-phosphate synthase small subunit
MTDIFPTALLVLSNGTIIEGFGFGAETENVGEICFNTGLTGYQETLTDPSYAAQIITFTFPHIGNTGTNLEDQECLTPYALGLITREKPTNPSNFRNDTHFNDWLESHNLPGIYGIDTRALTRHIRDNGAPNGVLAVNYKGQFDRQALQQKAANWAGLVDMDLAKIVSTKDDYEWDENVWNLNQSSHITNQESQSPHVVAMDFGAKRNILRCLIKAGCHVTVVPATATANEILELKPNGVFLSNGPGDPAATGKYAIPAIRSLMDHNIPIFGICLGHQLLALALGGKTEKMHLGHRGANHPVKDILTSKVEITSQNHGFRVVPESLPDTVEITHHSLFDNSNEGLRSKIAPAFSVQYHPEASPGPMDSHYLFDRFVAMMNNPTKQAA